MLKSFKTRASVFAELKPTYESNSKFMNYRGLVLYNLTYGEHQHRTIVFTSVPFAGSYRYKDSFQLIPSQDDWVDSSIQPINRPNPVVLEFNSKNHKKHVL